MANYDQRRCPPGMTRNQNTGTCEFANRRNRNWIMWRKGGTIPSGLNGDGTNGPLGDWSPRRFHSGGNFTSTARHEHPHGNWRAQRRKSIGRNRMSTHNTSPWRRNKAPVMGCHPAPYGSGCNTPPDFRNCPPEYICDECGNCRQPSGGGFRLG